VGRPLRGEHGEVELGAPLALEELVLDEPGLLPHAEPARHPGRGVVALVQPGDDAAQAEPVEAQPEDRPRGLRGVAAADGLGVQHVPDLAAAVLPAVPEQHHVADEPAGRRQLRAEGQRLALRGERRGRPGAGQPVRDHAGVHRLERQVAAHVGAAAVGQERVGVAGGERPERQAGGAHRVLGS
jgi:hypothetical protein